MAEKKVKEVRERRFLIYNTTRAKATRTQRALAPQHSKTTLLLGAGLLRIMRARPLPVTESVVRKLQAELITKEEAGLLYVATSAGLRVDLATLDVVERPKPVEPRPKKRLDSVANDANEGVGIPIPPYEDAIAQVQPVEPPTVGLPELPDSNEPAEDEVMSVLDELVEEKSDEPTPAPVEVLVEEAVPAAEVPDPPTEPEPEDPPPTRSRKGRQRKRRGR